MVLDWFLSDTIFLSFCGHYLYERNLKSLKLTIIFLQGDADAPVFIVTKSGRILGENEGLEQVDASF